MTTTTSEEELRDRVRAADTALHITAYSPDQRDELLRRAMDSDDKLIAPPTPARRRTRPRAVSRVPVMAAAAAALVGVTVATGFVLLPDHAVAAEMERLATHAAGPVPGHRYLYTETKTVEVGGTSKPHPDDRRWDTTTIRAWTGDTCDDQVDTVLSPTRFFTIQDEKAFRATASPQDLRTALQGWTATARGADLRTLDDVPCTQVGTFTHPNPAYAATYPTTADEFLAKAVHDSGAEEDSRDLTPADAVLRLLALPYLDADRRAAALRALGMAAGEWQVSGHATVAGITGVILRRNLGPVDEELVVSATAPGLLRSVLTIADPGHAAEYDPRYTGLAIGTQVHHLEVQAVAVVTSAGKAP